jgi:hypothetical protein
VLEVDCLVSSGCKLFKLTPNLGMLGGGAGSSNALYPNVLAAAAAAAAQQRTKSQISNADSAHQSPPMKVNF